MEISEKIKTLRQDRGWSQSELASRIGARSAGSVSLLEKGARGGIRPSMVARLAAAFEMSEAELLAGTDLAPDPAAEPVSVPEPETDPAEVLGRILADVLAESLVPDQLHMIADIIRMPPDKAPDVRRVLDAVLAGIEK